MKRHFLTGLKAFAVSALAFAAVSCYDDSELWGELEGLEQRVAALEEKLNSEVATLNSKIGAVETAYKAADADLLKKLNDLDAKLVAELAKLAADLDAADGSLDGLVTTDDLAAEIKKLTDAANAKYAELAGVDKEILAALTKVAVTKVEKNAAGNAVLTFLDGTTLEVGAADANANNTGLVTVVDGKWAIVGADGKTTVLDALVHPDTELEFKVDPKSYEVFVSYDGEEWIATGVIVKDAQTINLVTGFVDAKDHVVITVGGVEYKLPKVSTNSFDIVSGMLYFNEGETKVVPVEVTGMQSFMIASSPKGWDVSFDEKSLKITAPVLPADDEEGEADIEDDMGMPGVMPTESSASFNTDPAQSGTVEVWILTNEGIVLSGKVAVSLDMSPAVITVDSEYNVHFEFGYTESRGGYKEAFKVFYGAVKADEFDTDELLPKLADALNYFELGDGIYWNYIDWEWTLSADYKLTELLGSELVPGEQYIVWAISPKSTYDENYNVVIDATTEDFVKCYVNPIEVKVVVSEDSVTAFDADVEISVKGVDKYYAVVLEDYIYDMYMEENWSDEALAEVETTFKEAFLYAASGGDYYTDDYTGRLSKLGVPEEYLESGYLNEVYPLSKYAVCILPIDPMKFDEDYTIDDLHVEWVETSDLLYGSATLSFAEPKVDYLRFDIPFEMTNADYALYHIWTKDNFDATIKGTSDEATLENAVDYFIDNYGDLTQITNEHTALNVSSYYVYNEIYGRYIANDIAVGTEYVVVALPINLEEGKMGEAVMCSVKTKEIERNTNLSVSAAVTYNPSTKKATAVFNATGNPEKIIWICNYNDYSEATMSSNIANILSAYPVAYGSWNYVECSTNLTKEFNCPFMSYGYTYHVYALAIDSDGKVSEMIKVEVVDPSVKDEKGFISAVKNGGNIYLGGNITLDENITILVGEEVNINLCGKTLTYENNVAAGYAISNYGNLTITNGNIIGKGTQFAPVLYNEGEATLNCNITSENSNAIKVDKGGKLTINGGKYVSKNATGQAVRVGNWVSRQASAWELNINGGEFVAPWAALYIVNNYEGLETAGKAVIKNASFEGSMEVVTDGVKGGDIVFDKVKDVTIEDCTLKTQSIHSETTGESVINGKTITTIDNVYSTVFAAE